MKVRELLDSSDKWTQGAFARDKDEEPVEQGSPEAIKWCLAGAIRRCYPLEKRYRIVSKVENIIKKSVGAYNDTHSYEKVIELVRRLDI